MTAAQKKLRAQMKKELQAEGKLPLDKPRLNRKKFVEEARREWNFREDCLIWDLYIMEAISMMLGKTEKSMRTSPEAVGVAKVLKLALRLKEFSDMLKREGRTKYTVGEQYEFVKDILDA